MRNHFYRQTRPISFRGHNTHEGCTLAPHSNANRRRKKFENKDREKSKRDKIRITCPVVDDSDDRTSIDDLFQKFQSFFAFIMLVQLF